MGVGPKMLLSMKKRLEMKDQFDKLKLAISNQLRKNGKSKDEVCMECGREVDLRKQINECKIELNNLYKKYEEDVKSVQKKMIEIAFKCKHYEIKYYSDPSGNNDSGYICQTCGKDRHSKKELGGIWAN